MALGYIIFPLNIYLTFPYTSVYRGSMKCSARRWPQYRTTNCQRPPRAAFAARMNYYPRSSIEIGEPRVAPGCDSSILRRYIPKFSQDITLDTHPNPARIHMNFVKEKKKKHVL